MCIILYKPAGVELPGTKTLKTCWDGNHDGAGFMYPTKDGNVQVVKGLMTFKDLTAELARYDWKDVPLVVHFRIGTHGGNTAGNTHPFPVTENEKMLAAKRSSAPVALAHNGIISLCGGYGKDGRSDTFRFVRDYASNIITRSTYYREPKTVKVLGKLAASKLAIMSKDGHVELIGSFEHAKDGCFYSNGTYKPWKPVARTTRMSHWSEDGYSYPFGFGLDDDLGVGSSTRAALPSRLFDFDDEGPHVLATFVPEAFFVLEESTGEQFLGNSDLFVFDRSGRVYLYDDAANHIVLMDGYSVIDPDMNVREAKTEECVSFRLATSHVA